MNIFESCKKINDSLLSGNDQEAREYLIKLLNDGRKGFNDEYSELVNHLIRETGLYQYIDDTHCIWEDKFIREAFKIDCGYDELITLHREQSLILKKLLNGKNIVVSAPTSFGKSFIIDAFIAIRNPKNVVIIVPTIALTDETRRRICKKFSDQYKIITTSEASLAKKNILIFPQERALNYIDTLKNIDILIIDEFYKVSSNFGDDRAASLYKAIVELSAIATQKYFLAPNIKSINDSSITQDMEFIDKLDFNTVVLEEYKIYNEISSEEEKSERLVELIKDKFDKSKTIIYTNSHTEIKKVASSFVNKLSPTAIPLLKDFSEWLKYNFSAGWVLPFLIERGIGIHTGQMHRAISQLQIKLFEEDNGLKTILSTSSIIEGVNTSAENVVIWKSKIGNSPLNSFTYKNIIGRGGRMFKYFVGKVYLFDKPPQDESNQLEIEFPEKLLGSYDETNMPEELSNEQKSKNDSIRNAIIKEIKIENYKKVFDGHLLQTVDMQLALNIIKSLKTEEYWNGFACFLSDNPNVWSRLLYKVIELTPADWDSGYRSLVEFTKIISQNWVKTIPELLDELGNYDIDQFFKLERTVCFKFSSLLSDVNILFGICRNSNVDISPFTSKIAYAFLPKLVYQLEEYGLPRMISKKISDYGIVKFEENGLDVYILLSQFIEIGFNRILERGEFTKIEEYILHYFFDGILIDKRCPMRKR